MPKSVAEKLLVKPGDAVSITGATAEERALLDPLPEGTMAAAASEATVAATFVRSTQELLERFGSELPVLGAARAVWFLYPKAGRADVNRDVIIRESGAFGWRPISNVSVDDVWSAVRVRPLAEGEAPAV